ncbi:MAG: glycosyltransferase [Candidatus Omnitrophica bacterium]|nr:glycosyltransferase [Candidatus Omnitrophota bacterium]
MEKRLGLAGEALRQFFESTAGQRDAWKRRNRYYHRAIEIFYQRVIPPGAKVVELGCSTGDLLAAVKPRDGLGVDWSPTCLRLAKQKNPHLRFLERDLETWNHAEPFEYVILSDLLGTLQDIQAVFKRVHPLCTPRTRLVITYFNYLWEPILRMGQRIGWRMPYPTQNWLPLQQIEHLLSLSDFEVVASGGRVLLPVWIPGLSWFLNTWVAHLPGIRRLGLLQTLVARPSPRGQEVRPASCSVIVPARNERGTVEELVRRVPEMGASTELIFIEGGSRDGTWEEIQRVQAAYPHKRILAFRQAGSGKADAVREGFLRATGDVAVILDADLSVAPEDLPKFVEALQSGKGEFINGCRLVYPMDGRAMQALNLAANTSFGMLFSFLLDQPLRDTLCGTKAVWRADVERIFKQRALGGINDPFGDFELLLGAAKLHLKIVEVPVRYRERVYGSTNIRRWRHGWMLLRMAAFAAKRLKFSS